MKFSYKHVIFSSFISDASCEITQMAAKCGDSSFCQYVLPSVVIQETASRITGLTCDGSQLYIKMVFPSMQFPYRSV